MRVIIFPRLFFPVINDDGDLLFNKFTGMASFENGVADWMLTWSCKCDHDQAS